MIKGLRMNKRKILNVVMNRKDAVIWNENLLITMSLVLFDSEAAEAAPAAISCFERIIVVGISLTFELSATSSSNSTM